MTDPATIKAIINVPHYMQSAHILDRVQNSYCGVCTFVCMLAPMKRDCRTVRIKDRTHKMASKLSDRFGVSITALVEIGILNLSRMDSLSLPPRDKRSAKINSRRAVECACSGRE